MLRPREGHEVHIEQSLLKISPAHSVRFIQDVYGNSIAVVDFTEQTSELTVYSEVVLDHYESDPFDFQIEPVAVWYPFFYPYETFLELSVLIQPVYPGDALHVQEWVRRFWQPGRMVETLALLQDLNRHINSGLSYKIRDEPGVQSPAQTLTGGSGSCRDFATLFIEACRGLHLAARFVSGYILAGGPLGAGASTHAWAEVYLPGVGWKGFDPTLGVLTTAQHVPVAVSRHPELAMPISGMFYGPSSAFVDMRVNVRVEEVPFHSTSKMISGQSQSSRTPI